MKDIAFIRKHNPGREVRLSLRTPPEKVFEEMEKCYFHGGTAEQRKSVSDKIYSGLFDSIRDHNSRETGKWFALRRHLIALETPEKRAVLKKLYDAGF